MFCHCVIWATDNIVAVNRKLLRLWAMRVRRNNGEFIDNYWTKWHVALPSTCGWACPMPLQAPSNLNNFRSTQFFKSKRKVWEHRETVMVGEYCWAMTQATGRSCWGRSGSVVLESGFQLHTPVYTCIIIIIITWPPVLFASTGLYPELSFSNK
jgi:hypothetical protein